MTQRDALDVLKMGHNIYLTGQAGSGKTHLLNQYIDFLRKEKVGVGVTASTGIAATHMDGMTIHSWVGMGIRETMSPDEIEKLAGKKYLRTRLKNTKVLIIDEVSMLSSAQLDLVNMICQVLKANWNAFGGMQVILSGDFFQLPPVRREGEPARGFVFQSRAWDELDFHICYLEEQFRQQDAQYLAVLNAIRTNSVSEVTLAHLRRRYRAPMESGLPVAKLYTHNVNVDAINEQELGKISYDSKQYDMKYSGAPGLVEILKKSCLAPELLQLKKGAAVMFVKNNFEKGYVNGTLGEVVEFDTSGFPVVKTHKEQKIVAAPESWRIEENGKVRAEVLQVPLRLAWAITVHKSQGMSLDAAEIDLSQSFEPGMGYVALSRVRSLEGVRLMGLNKTALQVNTDVLAKDGQFQEQSAKAVDSLHKMSAEEKLKRRAEFEKRLGIKRKPAPGRAGRPGKKTSTTKGDEGLFQELRRLRARLARERNVAAFIIFPDSALLAMAANMPQSMEEFSDIKGVGEQKLQDLGPAFISAIKVYTQKHGGMV